MAILTMDTIGTLDLEDYLYVVVQIAVPYTSNVARNYAAARKLRIQSEFESVILAIQPDTLQAIRTGELTEIII